MANPKVDIVLERGVQVLTDIQAFQRFEERAIKDRKHPEYLGVQVLCCVEEVSWIGTVIGLRKDGIVVHYRFDISHRIIDIIWARNSQRFLVLSFSPFINDPLETNDVE